MRKDTIYDAWKTDDERLETLNLLPDIVVGLHFLQTLFIFVGNQNMYVWIRRVTATFASVAGLGMIALAAKELEDKRVFLI